MPLQCAVTLFAFSTVLGWSFYGTKAWEYLFGAKSTIIYKIIFIGVILACSTLSADLVIDLSDTFNGLMAIPNLIGVLTLSGTVMAITKNYKRRRLAKTPDTTLKPMLSYSPEIQAQQESAFKED